MPKVTIDLTEDDFWRLRYRAEALGLSGIKALLAKWIADDDLVEDKVATLQVLIDNGIRSGVSTRSLEQILSDVRSRPLPPSDDLA